MKRNVFRLMIMCLLAYWSCNLVEECEGNAYKGMVLFSQNCASCHKRSISPFSESSERITLSIVKQETLNPPKNRVHKSSWGILSDCDKKDIEVFLCGG